MARSDTTDFVLTRSTSTPLTTVTLTITWVTARAPAVAGVIPATLTDIGGSTTLTVSFAAGATTSTAVAITDTSAARTVPTYFHLTMQDTFTVAADADKIVATVTIMPYAFALSLWPGSGGSASGALTELSTGSPFADVRVTRYTSRSGPDLVRIEDTRDPIGFYGYTVLHSYLITSSNDFALTSSGNPHVLFVPSDTFPLTRGFSFSGSTLGVPDFQEARFTAVDDTFIEQLETMTLVLKDVVQGGAVSSTFNGLLDPASVTLTITDNDAVTIEFVPFTAPTGESGGYNLQILRKGTGLGTFAVTLSYGTGSTNAVGQFDPTGVRCNENTYALPANVGLCDIVVPSSVSPTIVLVSGGNNDITLLPFLVNPDLLPEPQEDIVFQFATISFGSQVPCCATILGSLSTVLTIPASDPLEVTFKPPLGVTVSEAIGTVGLEVLVTPVEGGSYTQGSFSILFTFSDPLNYPAALLTVTPTTKVLSTPVVNDVIVSDDRVISVSLGSITYLNLAATPGAAGVGTVTITGAPLTLTVTEDDFVKVSIAASTTTAVEGVYVTLTLTRFAGSAPNDFTVDILLSNGVFVVDTTVYSVLDESNLPSFPLTSVSSTLNAKLTVTFISGQVSRTVKVQYIDNAVVENSHTLTASLQNPLFVTAAGSYAPTIDGTGSVSVTFTDNDGFTVRMRTPGANSINEGLSVPFYVERVITGTNTLNTNGGAITVNVNVVAGSCVASVNYINPSGSTVAVTIPAGQSEGTFNVDSLNDLVAKPASWTCSVGASLGTNSAPSGVVFDTTPVPYANIKDINTISFAWSATGVGATEGGASVSITLSRFGDGTNSVSISVSVDTSAMTTAKANSADVTFSPVISTAFTSASAGASVSLSVTAANDGLCEPQFQTLYLSLSSSDPVSLPSGPTGVVVIQDPTRCSIAFTAITGSGAEPATGSTPVSVQITRTGGTGSFSVPVFFGAPSDPLAATGGSDYSPASAVATFADGDPTASVTVNILADTSLEVTEYFLATLGTVSLIGAEEINLGASNQVSTITITDNAQDAVKVKLGTVPATVNEGNSLNIAVIYTTDTVGVPGFVTSFTVAVAGNPNFNPSDVASTTFTILSTDYTWAQVGSTYSTTYYLGIVDDTIAEDNEGFVIAITGVQGATGSGFETCSACFTVDTPSSATSSINANDGVVLGMTLLRSSVGEAEGTVFDVFAVVCLSGPGCGGNWGTASVTVGHGSGSTVNDAQYLSDYSHDLTVTAAGGGVPIGLTIVDDAVIERNTEAIQLTLTGYTLGTAEGNVALSPIPAQLTASATVTDDDAVTVSLSVTPGTLALDEASIVSARQVTFTVSRLDSGSRTGTIKVPFLWTLVSPTFSADFMPIGANAALVSGNLITLTPASPSVSIVFEAQDDAIPEDATETSDVSLGTPYLFEDSSCTTCVLSSAGVLTVTITDNDSPVTIQMSSSIASTMEGSPVTFDITRDKSGGSIAVKVAVTSSTISYPGQWGPITTADGLATITNGVELTVNFADGVPTRTITIPTADNSYVNNPEQIIATLTSIVADAPVTPTSVAYSAATFGAALTTTITVGNNDLASVAWASLAATSGSEGNSGTQQRTFTLNRLGSGTNAFTVTLTSGGSASSSTDYSVTNFPAASFGVGVNSVDLVVTIFGDTLCETDETIFFTISSVSDPLVGLPADLTVGTTITNDEICEVKFTFAAVGVTEPNTGSTPLSLQLTRGSGWGAFQLGYTLSYTYPASSADLGAFAGYVDLPADPSTGSIQLNILADSTPEDAEEFTVTLNSVINYNADATFMNVIGDPIVVTITDIDTLHFTFALTPSAPPAQENDIVQLSVTLTSHAGSLPISVYVAFSPSATFTEATDLTYCTDSTCTAAALSQADKYVFTFSSGVSPSTITHYIRVTDDTIAEPAESITLSLGSVGGGPSCTSCIDLAPGSLTLNVASSDPVSLSLSLPVQPLFASPAASNTVAEPSSIPSTILFSVDCTLGTGCAGNYGTFSVTFSITGSASLIFGATPGSDVTLMGFSGAPPLAPSVAMTPTSAGVVEFYADVLADTRMEIDETFTIKITSHTLGTAEGNVAFSYTPTFTFTITDEDHTTVVLSGPNPALLSQTEASTYAWTVHVTRVGGGMEPFQVDLAVAGSASVSSDYTLAPAVAVPTLTFAQDEVDKLFTFTILVDQLAEPTEYITLGLSSAIPALEYGVSCPSCLAASASPVALTILDSNPIIVHISPGPTVVAQEDETTTSLSVNVVRSDLGASASGLVRALFSITGGFPGKNYYDPFEFLPGGLILQSVTTAFPIALIDDYYMDPTKSLTVTLALVQTGRLAQQLYMPGVFDSQYYVYSAQGAFQPENMFDGNPDANAGYYLSASSGANTYVYFLRSMPKLVKEIVLYMVPNTADMALGVPTSTQVCSQNAITGYTLEYLVSGSWVEFAPPVSGNSLCVQRSVASGIGVFASSFRLVVGTSNADPPRLAEFAIMADSLYVPRNLPLASEGGDGYTLDASSASSSTIRAAFDGVRATYSLGLNNPATTFGDVWQTAALGTTHPYVLEARFGGAFKNVIGVEITLPPDNLARNDYVDHFAGCAAGLVDYTIEAWDPSLRWQKIQSVTGNNQCVREFFLPPPGILASKIRIVSSLVGSTKLTVAEVRVFGGPASHDVDNLLITASATAASSLTPVVGFELAKIRDYELSGGDSVNGGPTYFKAPTSGNPFTIDLTFAANVAFNQIELYWPSAAVVAGGAPAVVTAETLCGVNVFSSYTVSVKVDGGSVFNQVASRTVANPASYAPCSARHALGSATSARYIRISVATTGDNTNAFLSEVRVFNIPDLTVPSPGYFALGNAAVTTTGATSVSLTVLDRDFVYVDLALAGTTDGASVVEESVGTYNFVVTRSGRGRNAFTVVLDLTGTATFGADYALGSLPGCATFMAPSKVIVAFPDLFSSPGVTTCSVPVTVTDDTLAEGSESLTGTLLASSLNDNETPAGYYYLGTVTAATFNIGYSSADDVSIVFSSAPSVVITEPVAGAAGVSLSLLRTGGTGSLAVEIAYGGSATFGSGVDYDNRVTSVSFSGVSPETILISINVLADDLAEDTEDITIALSAFTAGVGTAWGPGLAFGTPASVLITIQDVDGITLSFVSGVELVAAEGQAVAVELIRSGTGIGTISAAVTYSSPSINGALFHSPPQLGDDFTPVNYPTLFSSIPDLVVNPTGRVYQMINILADGLCEDAETFTLTLQPPSGLSPGCTSASCLSLGLISTLTIRIAPSDPILVRIVSIQSSVSEGAGTAQTIQLGRTGGSGPIDVVLAYGSTTGTTFATFGVDYVGPTSLTLGGGYLALGLAEEFTTVPLTLVSDTLIELQEAVVVTLVSATNPSGGPTTGSISLYSPALVASVDIRDDDGVAFALSATTSAVIAESSAGTVDFVITRTGTGSASFDVTVVIEAALGPSPRATLGADFTVSTGASTATFVVNVPANAGSQPFSIAPVWDSLPELQEYITLRLAGAVQVGSPALCCVTVDTATLVTVTLQDSDGITIDLSVIPGPVTEADGTVTVAMLTRSAASVVHGSFRVNLAYGGTAVPAVDFTGPAFVDFADGDISLPIDVNFIHSTAIQLSRTLTIRTTSVVVGGVYTATGNVQPLTTLPSAPITILDVDRMQLTMFTSINSDGSTIDAIGQLDENQVLASSRTVYLVIRKDASCVECTATDAVTATISAQALVGVNPAVLGSDYSLRVLGGGAYATDPSAIEVSVPAGGPGAGSQVVLELVILADSISEDVEAVKFTLSPTIAETSLQHAIYAPASVPQVVTISANDQQVLSFDTSAISISESAGPGPVTVLRLVRTPATVGGFTAHLVVTPQTASLGADFTVASLDIFCSGIGSTPVLMTMIPDGIAEADETFTVSIAGYTLDGDAQGGVSIAVPSPLAVVTITNIDVAFIRFASQVYTASSESGSVTVEILRSGTATGTFKVAVSVTGTSPNAATIGVDYLLPNSGSPVLVASAGGATTAYVVSITPDSLAEGDEVIQLTLGSLDIASPGLTFGSCAACLALDPNPAFATTVITIPANDPVIFRLAAPLAVTTQEPAGSSGSAPFAGGVVISRSGGSGTVRLHLTYGPGPGPALAGSPSDYAQVSYVDFTSTVGGDAVMDVPITIAADSLIETSETFSVTLSSVELLAAPDAATGSASLHAQAALLTSQVIIADNPEDSTVISLRLVSGSAVRPILFDEGTSVTIRVERSGAGLGTSLSVPLAVLSSGTAVSGVDFTVTPLGTGLSTDSLVVFAAGVAFVEFRVDALADPLAEPQELFELSIGPSVTGAPCCAALHATLTSLQFAIADKNAIVVGFTTPALPYTVDEPASLSADVLVQAYATRESGGGSFSVSLSYAGSTRSGASFSGPATLTFAPTATTASVTISVPADAIAEEPLGQFIRVTMTSVVYTGTASGHVSIAAADRQASVTVTDSTDAVTVEFESATYTTPVVGVEDGAISVVLVRTGGGEGSFSVPLTFSGTAQAGGIDYSKPETDPDEFGVTTVWVPVVGSNPPKAKATKVFTVTQDTLAETAETIIITLAVDPLTTVVGATFGCASCVTRGTVVSTTVTIPDDDPITVTLSAATRALELASPLVEPLTASASDAQAFTLELTRSGTATGTFAVRIGYSAVSGAPADATAGLDFEAVALFPAGSNSVQVKVLYDNLAELTESVRVTLTEIVYTGTATGNVQLGAAALITTVLKIGDASAFTVELEQTSFFATDGTTVNLPLRRTGGTGAFTLTYFVVTGAGAGTALPADYSIGPGTVSFSSGQMTAVAAVQLNTQASFVNGKTIVVALSPTFSYASSVSNGALGARTSATITVFSNLTPFTVVFERANVLASEGAGTAVIRILKLATTAGAPVPTGAFDLVCRIDGGAQPATAGSDYNVAVASPLFTVSFTSSMTQYDLVVDILQDNLAERDESITVSLVSVSIALGKISTPSVSTLTIKDDETFAGTVYGGRAVGPCSIEQVVRGDC